MYRIAQRFSSSSTSSGSSSGSSGRGFGAWSQHRRLKKFRKADRFFDYGSWQSPANPLDPIGETVFLQGRNATAGSRVSSSSSSSSAGIINLQSSAGYSIGSSTSDANAQSPSHNNNSSSGKSYVKSFYNSFLNSASSTGSNGQARQKIQDAIVDPVLNEANTLMQQSEAIGRMLSTSNPRIIRQHLDQHIIGQDEAKEVMSCAIYNHYSRVHCNLQRKQQALQVYPSQPYSCLEKSNILLLGPSGSGKTLIAKKIAETLKVPFSMNDATTLTQAGYVGDDVDQCISRLFNANGPNSANGDAKRAEMGIVFIDEIDKISKKTESIMSSGRDVAGEGVQQALLKMLEGTTVYVTDKNNKKGDPVAIDTSNILFILSGAFVGLDQVVAHRLKGVTSLGFGAKVADKSKAADNFEALKNVSEADLIQYGFIPEFIGRVPIVASVSRLSEQELIRILTEPKNSLIDQYQTLFQSWKVRLDISNDALQSIVKRVIERKTGARGLKFALEEVLKEPMYLAPCSDIKEIKINGDLSAQYLTNDSVYTVAADKQKRATTKRQDAARDFQINLESSSPIGTIFVAPTPAMAHSQQSPAKPNDLGDQN
ncbi:hypothetical protein MIR68_001865 [Amoeboaphelidium protococcarum]|nr:hypothetical protein MIR68_001865 [Amoeboaphelidium protococcarum]